jgi:hypothetical protein
MTSRDIRQVFPHISSARKPLQCWLGAVVLVCGLGGCSSIMPGPCIVEYIDPILQITSITDQQTKAVIQTISIDSVFINGRFVPLSSLRRGNNAINQVKWTASAPVDFWNDEGSYTIYLSAEGYKPTTVNVSATYRTRRGSCPLTISDGERIDITLQPK